MQFGAGIGRFQCGKPTRPLTLLELADQWNSGWVLGVFNVESRPAPSPFLNLRNNGIQGCYWAFSMWKADPPLNPSGTRRPMEFRVGIARFQCRKPTRPSKPSEPTEQWNSGWVLGVFHVDSRPAPSPFLNPQHNAIRGGYWAFSMWKADPPLNPSGTRRPMEFRVGIAFSM